LCLRAVDINAVAFRGLITEKKKTHVSFMLNQP